MNWIDTCIDTAQKIGGLSAAAILSLVCFAQGYMIYRREKHEEDNHEKWRQTNDNKIRAEDAQTSVMERLVEVVAMNTSAISAQADRINHLATLIDERIPKRGN